MEAANFAFQDLRDVDACDVLVLFNPPSFPQSPGRNIEFGYALAKGKKLMIVGQPKGVFQYLPCVLNFIDIEEFREYMQRWNNEIHAPYEG